MSRYVIILQKQFRKDYSKISGLKLICKYEPRLETPGYWIECRNCATCSSSWGWTKKDNCLEKMYNLGSVSDKEGKGQDVANSKNLIYDRLDSDTK